jgi:microcystin-dependent protein
MYLCLVAHTATSFATDFAAGNWVQIGSNGASTGPIGEIIAFGGPTAPTGFLLCNHAAVSRTTYADLFAAIGTTWGAGDGSTTFNVPGGAGVFLRGTGSQTIGGVVQTGPALGATQNDQHQGHIHNYSDPGHSHREMNWDQGTGGSNNPVAPAVAGISNIPADSYTMTSGTGITITGELNDGANGAPRNGTTTYPANIGVNFYIRYLVTGNDINCRYYGDNRQVNGNSTLVFNGILDYDSSGSFNQANGQFTCPTAGKYRIGAMVRASPNSSWIVSQSWTISVYKNGSQHSQLDQYTFFQTGGACYMAGADTVKCVAGDIFTIVVYNAGSVGYHGTLAGDGYVTIEKVGG